MSINDHIADVLVRIKNAGNAKKDTTLVPYSKMKLAVLEVLERTGYIAEVAKRGKKVTKHLEVGIAYTGEAGANRVPRVHGARRASKLSCRRYVGVSDIKPVRSGAGLLVLSTSKGILTGEEARKENIGGEALFTIW